jgi:hypothetical protein
METQREQEKDKEEGRIPVTKEEEAKSLAGLERRRALEKGEHEKLKAELSGLSSSIDKINRVLQYVARFHLDLNKSEGWDKVNDLPLSDEEKQRIKIAQTTRMQWSASVLEPGVSPSLVIFAKALWHQMKKKIGFHDRIGPKEA